MEFKDFGLIKIYTGPLYSRYDALFGIGCHREPKTDSGHNCLSWHAFEAITTFKFKGNALIWLDLT
jgi:hypothetical protein